VRIHLGHHFYGAGNLGDDFMLGGFLAAMRTLAAEATYTASIPFPLEPVRRRFPQIDWRPYDATDRQMCIEQCDVWLGLGGAPFQSAQSRWFVDHLMAEAALCAQYKRPMFYLGVGVQSENELHLAEVQALCAQARTIWTRDAASAKLLQSRGAATVVRAAADLSHVLFQSTPPPRAMPGRAAIVANFDFRDWPAAPTFLAALDRRAVRERVWLVQEHRDLPGAEKALHAALSSAEQASWPLHQPDVPHASLAEVIARWPTPEWLLSSRYHAVLACAWGGSKIVVIGTNEKLRAVAAELGAPLVAPEATSAAIEAALAQAAPSQALDGFATLAYQACAEFVAAARANF